MKFKRSGSMNCRNHSDVVVSGVIVTESNGDVTMLDVNKPIVRKRYAPREQSLVHSKGILKSSLRVCSRTFTKIAFILAIVISILRGLCNIKLPERKSTIDTSSSLSPPELRVVLSFRDSSVLSILRESLAAIISISEGLCSCIRKGMFLNNNKQLIRRMKVLQNTIICEARTRIALRCHGYVMLFLQTFARNILAGKRFLTYIFPFADFWASHVYYFDAYTVNLELDDNFKVFFDLLYLYIFIFYRSWPSCNWATYPKAILVNICRLLWFIFPQK